MSTLHNTSQRAQSLSRVQLQPRAQKGLALITVMLVLALAVILATEIASRLNFSMRRAENWQIRQQGVWYAMGAEALAVQVLDEVIQDEPDKNHLDQAWAQETPPFPVDEVLIQGGYRDLNACFNLNALAEVPPANAPYDWLPPAREALEKLLQKLDVDSYEAEVLSHGLVDWIDENQDLAGSLGAEDSTYASSQTPHLTPDTPLIWYSEIRPVQGMTARLMDQLSEHLCVRPNDRTMQVNINTIPQENPEVLYAVLDGLVDMDTVELLLESRPDGGYDNIKEFMQEQVIAALDDADRQRLEKRLAVQSNWFLLSGKIESEQGRFDMSSLLHVKRAAGSTGQANQQSGVFVVSRKYGGAW